MQYQLIGGFLTLGTIPKLNQSRSIFKKDKPIPKFGEISSHKDMERVLSKLSQSENIRLQINEMELTDRIISIISEAKWPHLEDLIISCNFTTAHCRMLKKGLWKAQHLFLISRTLELNSFIKQSIICSDHLKEILVDRMQRVNLEELAQTTWPSLENIAIKNAQLEIQSLAYFNFAKWMQLTKLQLRNCGLGVKGIRQLVKIGFKQINFLNLHSNNIGNEGVGILVKGQFKQLSILQLSQNQIHMAGVKNLLKANWRLLERIFSYCNQSINESFQIYRMICLSNFHVKFAFKNKYFMDRIKQIYTHSKSRKYFNTILSNKFVEAKLFMS